jgi:hypothetical protein
MKRSIFIKETKGCCDFNTLIQYKREGSEQIQQCNKQTWQEMKQVEKLVFEYSVPESEVETLIQMAHDRGSEEADERHAENEAGESL